MPQVSFDGREEEAKEEQGKVDPDSEARQPRFHSRPRPEISFARLWKTCQRKNRRSRFFRNGPQPNIGKCSPATRLEGQDQMLVLR